MKVINKLPKYDKDVHAELVKNHWTPIKEPKNLINALLLSVPFMIINVLLSICILNSFSTITLNEFGIDSSSIAININLGIIILIILLVIIHELLHLIFIPNFSKSKQTFIGLTWFGGFVTTEEEISKPRYLLVTVAPFIIISVILPFLLGFYGVLTTSVKFLIMLNALASSVDTLNFLIVFKQVPRDGFLKSNGDKTYWRTSLKSIGE